MARPANAYILQHIYANIPSQILERAFQPEKYQVSLDERILGEVIASRVLMDTNLVAGRMTQILIQPEWMKMTDDGYATAITSIQYNSSLFWIPPEPRENRNISSIIRVLSGAQGMLNSASGNVGAQGSYGNSVSGMAGAMVASRTLNGAMNVVQASLEGNNLIKVYGNFPNTYFGGLTLECILEFDTEFGNADQNVLFQLRELALCATKMWIYNELVIRIDSAEMVAGTTLGVFKEIVSEYKSAAEEYNSKLMLVRGASLMDENRLGSLVRMFL